MTGISTLDWPQIGEQLDAHGCAILRGVLDAAQCRALSGSYGDEQPFRSRVVMSRHGFGRGEYKYFTYPLPPRVAAIRDALYAPLASIANRWNLAMGIDVRYPESHAAFLERCRAAGQTKATPLLQSQIDAKASCYQRLCIDDLLQTPSVLFSSLLRCAHRFGGW